MASTKNKLLNHDVPFGGFLGFGSSAQRAILAFDGSRPFSPEARVGGSGFEHFQGQRCLQYCSTGVKLGL